MTNNFWSGAGGSIVGSVLGFGGNLATSAINSSRSWKYTQRAMNYQDELNRAYTRDSYGLMREGLKKAGYNPLLALGSSANSAIYGASAPNADSDNGSQAVASAIDALRLRNETKLNSSQLDVNETIRDLNTQMTYKTFADELKARAESGVASATEAKIYNDINWDNIIKDAEFKRIIAETKFTNERARGFSASSSETRSGDVGAKAGVKAGTDGVGVDISGNRGQSKSKSWSKTW